MIATSSALTALAVAAVSARCISFMLSGEGGADELGEWIDWSSPIAVGILSLDDKFMMMMMIAASV